MRLIDADELIERLEKDPLFALIERYNISGVIEAAPTIEPVKTGKWINDNHQIKCSICENPIPIRRVVLRGETVWEDVRFVNYCPNCGARMEKVE